MNALPKGNAGKAQRIGFAPRANIKAIKETEAQTQRMFEAIAPPAGSGLEVPIQAKVVGIDLQEVMNIMNKVKAEFEIDQMIVISGHHAHRKDAVCAYLTPETVDTEAVMDAVKGQLHDYLIPLEIITLESFPHDPSNLPLPALKGLLHQYEAPKSATEQVVQDVWTEILGGEPLSTHADFFENVWQIISSLDAPVCPCLCQCSVWFTEH